MKSNPNSGSVGYYAVKRIKGEKRHILDDKLGLLLSVHLTPASTPDHCGAKEFFFMESFNGLAGCLSSGWMAGIVSSRLLIV